MAAQQFTLNYGPDPGQEVKKDVVISTPLVDPTANQIWVGFGATVETRRGTEIISAIDFLMSGIRDRILVGFGGNAVVSAVNINIGTATDRRTSSSLAASTVAGPDVVIAFGDGITALGYKVMHETHFEQLKRAVIEWLHANG